MTLLAEVVIFVMLREPDVGLQHLQHMIVCRSTSRSVTSTILATTLSVSRSTVASMLRPQTNDRNGVCVPSLSFSSRLEADRQSKVRLG